MAKVTLLLLLLIAGTFQQDILGSSDDNSASVAPSNIDISSLGGGPSASGSGSGSETNNLRPL